MPASPPTSILTLPGIHGSGSDHWQTVWERSLPGAQRVVAPDWDRPVCSGWVEALERAVARAGGDVILVAHSLGCLQAVHWARQTRHAVRGALLVAPPDPDRREFPEVAVGFAPLPRQRLPFPSTLIVSADDPYASAAFARRCADDWGSHLVEVGCRGHINAESGLGDWREGRLWLDKLMGSQQGSGSRGG